MFACYEHEDDNTKKNNMEYVVLLGEDSSNIDKFPIADIMVIDGEFYSNEDLKYLRDKGAKEIFSYLNIGSIENFRDYYEEYSEYILGEYENWPDEGWIDVSNEKWQKFVIERAQTLAKKGFDGFFVDNTDIYYQYQNKEIYQGLVEILKNLKNFDKEVIINGGDTFVQKYIKSGNDKIFDGVNQENVYTLYDFSKKEYNVNSVEDREYWHEYLEFVSENGYDVFVLEYATDIKIIKGAIEFCESNGWICYISDNIELKINNKI